MKHWKIIRLKKLVGISPLISRLLLWFAILFLPLNSIAQTKVQILQSDKLVGENSIKGQVQILKMNVKIKIDDTVLSCDSAFRYLDINEIRAYSRVFIQSDKEKIWADSAVYNSKTDLSFFYGNIVIEKDTTRLFSTKLSYSFPLKTAYLTEPFQLEDKKGLLRANRGIYFTELDSASFRGNVEIVDSTQYVKADSVLSNRKKELYELFGNVLAHDTDKKSTIQADYLYLDSTGYRKIRGHALLAKVDSAKTDTLVTLSKSIDYYEYKDSSFSFTAKDSVQIWSKDFSSFSDIAEYQSKTELFELISNALAWNKRMQLSADSILVQLKDDTVRTIRAFPTPFAVQPDSVSGRFHQMRGDSLHAWFKEGSISQVRFKPNAAVAFFSNNSEDKADGLMVIHSHAVDLFFDDGELNDLKASEDVKASYSEESESLEMYRLSGFIWKPELRPEKPEIPNTQNLNLVKKSFSTYPKHHPEYKKN